MGSRIRLSSMACVDRRVIDRLACVDRRVIDRLARTISEIDRCLMPQASVYPCGSPMRIVDMDGTRLNALVVVVVVAWYLRTTGPCEDGCLRLITSHHWHWHWHWQARMLIMCGSPRHGYLVFIDVRSHGPKARRRIRSTKVWPGVEVGYCPVLFIEAGLVTGGGAYPWYGGVTIQTGLSIRVSVAGLTARLL